MEIGNVVRTPRCLLSLTLCGFLAACGSNGSTPRILSTPIPGAVAAPGAPAPAPAPAPNANQAPLFDPIVDIDLQEEAGAQTLTITGLSAGTAAEDQSQSVSVTADTDNPGLLTNLSLSGTGAQRSLSFAIPADANGQAQVTITAQDDGGTQSGGVDTFSQSFQVRVAPVNDPPTLDAVSDQTASLNTPSSVTLTGVGAGGGADEATQPLTFTVTSSNPAMFSVLDVAGPTGNQARFDFTPAPGASGVASVTIALSDGGLQASTTFQVSLSALLGVTDGQFAKVNDQSGQSLRISGYGLSGLRSPSALTFDGSRFLAVDGELDQLFAIDPTSGRASAIGNPLGFSDVQGLAFNGSQGILYGADNASGSLIRIDTLTGQGTTIGAFGTGPITGLAYVPGSGLFGVLDAAPDRLVAINETSGTVQDIGAIGAADGINGLTFDAGQNVFLAQSGPNLLAINPSNAAPTTIGAGAFDQVRGLAIGDQGALLGLEIGAHLITINRSSGASAIMNRLANLDVRSAAFDPASGVLYAVDSRFNVNPSTVLLAIDSQGRARTVIGAQGSLDAQGFDNVEGLAFGAGVLWASTSENELFQINPSSGAVTPISSTLSDPLIGLAFGQGVLYGLARGQNGDRIFTVDQASGALNLIGALSNGSVTSGGLAFDTDNGALVAIDGGSRTLLSISPADASVIDNGTFDFSVVAPGGLAYDPTSQALVGTKAGPGQAQVVRMVSRGAGQLVRTTRVGQSNYPVLRGAAFDASAGIFYASDVQSDTLMSFDSATGDATIIGNIGFATDVTGLAFDSAQGILYGIDNSAKTLVTFDLNSGSRTTVGSLNTGSAVEGLAYDSINGLLFATDVSSDSLLLVDPASGNTTIVGQAGALGFDSVDGLAFDPGTGMLMGSDTATRQVVRIDPTTGVGAAVGSTGTLTLRGLAFGQ